jgi:hypothetical protein
MDFIEYLTKKKIDSEAFRKEDLSRFQEWERLFYQVHPESFTAQKKFYINDIRRAYLLKENQE